MKTKAEYEKRRADMQNDALIAYYKRQKYIPNKEQYLAQYVHLMRKMKKRAYWLKKGRYFVNGKRVRNLDDLLTIITIWRL